MIMDSVENINLPKGNPARALTLNIVLPYIVVTTLTTFSLVCIFYVNHYNSFDALF